MIADTDSKNEGVSEILCYTRVGRNIRLNLSLYRVDCHIILDKLMSQDCKFAFF